MARANDRKVYEMHADFCKFMGNPKRIEILFILENGEKCVEEIAKAMDIPVSGVSQNLSVMRGKGIVETRKSGVKVYYRLSDLKILEACRIMQNLMFEQLNKKIESIAGGGR